MSDDAVANEIEINKLRKLADELRKYIRSLNGSNEPDLAHVSLYGCLERLKKLESDKDEY